MKEPLITDAIRSLRHPELHDLTQVVALTAVRDCEGLLQDVLDELRKDGTSLNLYVHYSQLANDYSNVDNWFSHGLYKALQPLTRDTFDGSIQGRIAKEAADWLFVAGFDPKKLAGALEVAATHSDEKLYEDPALVTRLCKAAHDYLQTLGIKSIVVLIDGPDATAVPSVPEAGRDAMVMLRAWKEEAARRQLPWLSVVAFLPSGIASEIADSPVLRKRITFIEASND